MKSKRVQLAALVVLLGLLGVVLAKEQAIQDWLRLYNYTPPSSVAALAQDDTMTTKAEHLFYVNHPDISSGSTFTSNCPSGSEKTVVLGCYIGNDAGTYIYAVSDSRLDGVEQVTAAHEMLHAAYRRLSKAERTHVDALLTNYYEHDLTDQRIKDTIAAYKQSEPGDVVNEMHSVFGTEVANLPAPLEQYYRQYFTDRAKITAYTAGYENEFTSRQAAISQYDTQLKDLKTQITSSEAALTEQKAALDTQLAQLQQERASGQITAYNNAVGPYNAAVESYNQLLTSTKSSIKMYNDIVVQRNAIALEERELAQDLSASSLPATQ